MSETQTSAAPEAAAPDLADSLGAVWDKMGTEAPQEAAAEPSEPIEKPALERPRDEHGRFAPKEQAAAEEAPAKDAVQKPAEGQVEPAAKEPEPAIDMPAAWTAQMREEWQKLPPAVRKYVSEREAEAHKRITALGEEGSRYRPLEEVLAPRRQALAAEGLNEVQVVQAMFAIRDMLFQNPAQAIQLLARQSGVDLARLGAQPAEQGPPADPYTARLEQRLGSLEQHTQAAQQAAADAEQRRLIAQIDEFAKGKTDFALVKATMGRLMTSGEATTLDDAYERARWIVPETREALLSQQKAEAAETARKEQAQKADDARRAAAANVRGVTAATAAAPKSWHDTVAEAGNRAYAR